MLRINSYPRHYPSAVFLVDMGAVPGVCRRIQWLLHDLLAHQPDNDCLVHHGLSTLCVTCLDHNINQVHDIWLDYWYNINNCGGASADRGTCVLGSNT